MEVAQAIQLILAQGLVPIVQYATDPTTPAGSIVPGSQSPAAGTVVRPGTQQALVSFVVSTGPPQATGNVSMPNLVGLDAYSAQQQLAALSLSMDKIGWVISPNPEGTVVSQSVAPGSSVPAGITIVKLFLSQGPTRVPVTVPVPTVS